MTDTMFDSSPENTSISPNMLAELFDNARQVVEQRKKEVPLAGMRALATMQRRPYDLSSALREDPQISLIVQIKRRSPDRIEAIENYDPIILAKRFEGGGARALSVATNRKFYQGAVADLTLVTQNINLPVIRQDFIYDEYQVVEARAAGADAVLLMASMLEPAQLRNLISITQRNRMTEVIQVQSEAEIREALPFQPRVIAISNRDMRDFTINAERTLRLRDMIPPDVTVISMGGLQTAEHVAMVYKAGIDAIMVGHVLLTAPDTAQAIHELFKLTNQR